MFKRFRFLLPACCVVVAGCSVILGGDLPPTPEKEEVYTSVGLRERDGGPETPADPAAASGAGVAAGMSAGGGSPCADDAGTSMSACSQGSTVLMLSSGERFTLPSVGRADAHGIRIPLHEQTVWLQLVRAAGFVTVDGEPIMEGERWTSSTLAPGETRVTVEVDEGGGAVERYGIQVVRGGEEQLLRAARGESGDHFGFAVAISGDLMAIGAPGDDSGIGGVAADPALRDLQMRDNGGSNTGAVHLYRKRDDRFELEGFLQARAVRDGARFGLAVAALDDTVVVASESGTEAFQRSDSGPWESAGFIAGNHTAVALAGDYLLVGAPWGGSKAELFIRRDRRWDTSPLHTFTCPLGEGACAHFGRAVALRVERGEVTAVVSAPSQRVGEASAAGAVFVYRLNAMQTWSHQQLVSPTLNHNQFFGSSLAIRGARLAVADRLGIPSMPEVDSGDGQVCLFIERAGSFTLQPSCITVDSSALHTVARRGNRLGASVAMSDDLLVGGAPWEGSGRQETLVASVDHDAPQSGAVAMWALSGGEPAPLGLFKASNAQTMDQLGGTSLGSYDEETQEGKRPIFLDSCPESEVDDIRQVPDMPNAQRYLSYGNVAIDKDIVVAGAHCEDGSTDAQEDSGAVYVFR